MKKRVMLYASLGLLCGLGLTTYQVNAEESQNVAVEGNTVETSLKTDVNDHITGSRLPDSTSLYGIPCVYDKIEVNKISQTRTADGKIYFNIDGFMSAATYNHTMKMYLYDTNMKLITHFDYDPGYYHEEIALTSGKVTGDQVVGKVVLRVADAFETHYITAAYKLTDDEKPFHAAPTISGVDNKEIELNSDFDPMEGVTASDWNNVDLTSKISVTGTVVTSIPGQYTLTYSVTDSEGKTTTVDRVITVKEDEKEIPAPTVNEPVTNQDTTITGKGDTPGNTITVTNQITGDILGTGVVQEDGSFTITMPAQDSYTILSVTETNGTKTSPATTVVVHEGTPVEQNTITGLDTYSISYPSYWVTGTYEGADVARVRLIVDDKILPSVPAKDGKINYYAADVITSPTQTVKVQILDALDKVLDTKTLTVTA